MITLDLTNPMEGWEFHLLMARGINNIVRIQGRPSQNGIIRNKSVYHYKVISVLNTFQPSPKTTGGCIAPSGYVAFPVNLIKDKSTFFKSLLFFPMANKAPEKTYIW